MRCAMMLNAPRYDGGQNFVSPLYSTLLSCASIDPNGNLAGSTVDEDVTKWLIP